MRVSPRLARNLAFGLVITFGPAAASTLAACTQAELAGTLRMLSERGAAAPASEKAGQKVPPVMTPDAILDFAPMSEDFGPEIVGPYTFAKIIPDYLDDLQSKGFTLTRSWYAKTSALVERLCAKAQASHDRVPDMIAFLSAEKPNAEASPAAPKPRK